jgi:hypothetical protein
MNNKTLIITAAILLVAVAVFFVGKYQGRRAG